MTNSLSTAELAIYAALAIPVIFIFVRHFPAGFLGWGYLFAFCSLRLVGGALSMNNSSPSASIISSVGLSPILLAAGGILHEARIYRAPDLNRKLEWIFVLFFHVLVAAGVGLLAAGASSLQGSHPKPIDETLIKVGIGILTASWVILVGWAVASILPGQHTKAALLHREGSFLLFSVCFSLIFIGIRVFYSLIALTTGKASLNPVTGSLVIRVVLAVVPELIATVAFILAGLGTQNASRIFRNESGQSRRGSPKRQYRSSDERY